MRTASSCLAILAGLYGICYVVAFMAVGSTLGDQPVDGPSIAWVAREALLPAAMLEGALVTLWTSVVAIGWAWDR